MLRTVLPHAAPDAAFRLASAWAQAQQPRRPPGAGRAKRARVTPIAVGPLLECISWDMATREQLRAIAATPCADDIPGLHKRLYEAAAALLDKQ